MDSRSEIRDFLTSRRGRIKPDQTGLPAYGGNRRVTGLRREEVALLAGVSVDYYTRLERGNLSGVSESVLEAITRALQLDEAERIHLFDLARAANTSPAAAAARSRRRPAQQLRPAVQWILDAMTMAPAYVRNGHLDILAANQLGKALMAPVFDMVTPVPNLARFIFLDPTAREFYLEWERMASDTVALLRAEAGRDPYNRALCDLIGELSTRNEFFRTRWAAHNVKIHRNGIKQFRHPIVGELSLVYESMELISEPGLRLNAYTAEPGSPTQAGLSLLASWAATPADPKPSRGNG